jgi:predicted dithiol-disulfide oxidoreductase (DUF899 family)
MTIHEIRFPGESPEYRQHRDQLLTAEMALREQIEAVARLRQALPLGGVAEDYSFMGAQGSVSLSTLFGEHQSLIVYSFMFGGQQVDPCPMCSAFMDSLRGHIHHLTQRAGFVAVARSPYDTLQKLVNKRGWQDITWVSAAENTYPLDYHSEMPNGAQVPMCNVFTRRNGQIHHFWNSELFFAPTQGHPRHIDMIWPLWHCFDLLPEGRGEFLPKLNYAD